MRATQLLIAASSLAMATTSHAQTADSAADYAAQSAFAGDDIIVTARRRDEKLQDVPVAVTYLGGDRLEGLGVRSAVDLRTVVAGLSVTNGAGRPSTPLYAIRGQRAGDQVFTQDPPVAVYLDEVIVSPVAGSNTGLFDLENVQVLKGPQGTLFGRNTTGGAVLYTSARPTDDFEGKVTAGYGNYDYWRAGGFINIPAGEGLKVRAAVDYQNNGGYGKVVEGPEKGKGTQGYESFAGRLSVDMQPTDWMQVLTIAGYSKYTDEGGPAFKIVDTPRPFGAADYVFNYTTDAGGNLIYTGALAAAIADQRSRSVYDYKSPVLNGAESEIFTVSNHLTIELSDDLTLKNIVGYRHLDTWDAADYDGTLLPILDTSNAARAKTFSEELQLQGSAFDGKLDYIFGLYYFSQSGIEGTGTPFMNSKNALVGTVAFGGPMAMLFARIKNKNFSGFSQINYHFNDKLTLTAGLRYSSDQRSTVSTSGSVIADPQTGLATPASCNFDDLTQIVGTGPNNTPIYAKLPATFAGCRIPGKASFSEPSWLIGIDWKPDADTLIYAAHRHSYRSGVLQSRPFDNFSANLPAAPEVVDDVELGFKRDWALGGDTRLRTNVAVYHQWYSDIQRNSVIITTLGIPGNVTSNAAKATIKGLELETELRFGSLVRIAANYAYTDPQYKTFLNTRRDPVTGAIIVQDRSNYRFGYIAKHQLNGSVEITPDIGDFADLTLSMNAYHTSSLYLPDDYSRRSELEFITGNAPLPPDNEIFYGTGSYTLFNARVELANINDSGVTVAAWGKNIFDKRYVDSGYFGQDAVGLGMGIYGAPATYGFDVSFKF